MRKFNEYSKKNNLNIKLNLNLITAANSTVLINDYGSTIESILSRKLDKYDVYFYDNIYTKRFGKHFIDLKKKLPKEHMDEYASGIGSKICISDGKWVSLVCIMYTLYTYIIF